MKNKFLKRINDEKSRIFPLNYKYVNIKEVNNIRDMKSPYVKVEFYNTNLFMPYKFTKPISKMV